MSEATALVVLAMSLAAAITRTRWAPDWAIAVGGALILVALGVISVTGARHALASFGPTIGFLAALLVLGDACRRSGLFEALGSTMAIASHGRPIRLLALVFAAAAGTTAVLSLDATVVLLTPIVFATAAGLRVSSRPQVYACSHLANTASLLLPVSNLTNLLAFHASRLSFTRFGALMALPWLAGLAIEWIVLTRAFRSELQPTAAQAPAPEAPRPLPRFALVVLALTLVGFAVSSAIRIAPAWVAALAALVMIARERPRPGEIVLAAQPAFLAFVLALAVIVTAASTHGLSSAVASLLPHGSSLLALMAIAVVSAVLANLVNNLPATLIVLPVVATSGAGPVLAMLIGVNVGPNVTYVGSLATLLWRRIVHAHDETVDVAEFVRLGALTVAPALVACTLCLWLALRVV
ncbi:MAG TPA: SLC13 family permease [Solirubrobacteraceae bacterium]|nr:SLC13 family permease [Solirubrobacteraceae bacterium]